MLQLTDEEAKSLVSVFSSLLAAFGFYYTAVKDRVRAGVVHDAGNKEERTEQRGLVVLALWPNLVVLALSSGVVAGLLWPAFGAIIVSTTREYEYSATKAALAALCVFWNVLAGYFMFQAVRALVRVLKW